MRDLTIEEITVLGHLRDAVNGFAGLSQSHPADMEEFVLYVHALQNIVLSRPATEKVYQVDEEVVDANTL